MRIFPRFRVAIVTAAVAASAVFLGRTGGDLATAAPATTILSVIGTADVHGAILPAAPGYGGLALFAGYVKNLRAARSRDAGAVVLVDAGDMFQGTLESNLNEGAAVLRAYNALRYDAAAIGNHEFDYGPVGEAATPQKPGDDPLGALKARAAEATFPFLAANLLEASSRQPVAWTNVRPSVLLTKAGVKVAVIGISTAATLTTTSAPNVTTLAMAPLAPTIADQARDARAAGADVVVVAAHAGGRCTDLKAPDDVASCDQTEEIMQVVRSLPPNAVDVIVAGHTHQAMATLINGIPVVESFSSSRAFGRVDIEIDRGTHSVLKRRIYPPQDICEREDTATKRCDPAVTKGKPLVPVVYEGARIRPDAKIAALVAPAVERARAMRAQKLGVTLDTPIPYIYDKESALGNLIADLMLAARPGADVALTNGGGLRADLPAGDLTYGAFYQAQPFDNGFAAVRMTGRDLKRVMSDNLHNRDGILLLAGARLKAICEGGELKASLVKNDGTEIGDSMELTVATSDFLATGPLKSVLPNEQMTLDPSGQPIRELMVAELKRRGGHLRDDAFYNPTDPRLVYPGDRPVACTK